MAAFPVADDRADDAALPADDVAPPSLDEMLETTPPADEEIPLAADEALDSALLIADETDERMLDDEEPSVAEAKALEPLDWMAPVTDESDEATPAPAVEAADAGLVVS